MRLKVFSIYDKATQAFNTPIFLLTKAEALRAFQNMARDEDTQISKNPLDFNLYILGTFDNISGEFSLDIQDLGSAASRQQDDENVSELSLAKEIQK